MDDLIKLSNVLKEVRVVRKDEEGVEIVDYKTFAWCDSCDMWELDSHKQFAYAEKVVL